MCDEHTRRLIGQSVTKSLEKKTIIRAENNSYIELGELVQNALETLVKVFLSELDLAHIKVTDTADGKVGVDDL